ncbi:MAG TPA: MBL fold metallo-hydrolase, partial [Acidimicrobiales bacterium]|nr:MBL fold metallo-hydrolase [Acidimicrobiales bacterium]
VVVICAVGNTSAMVAGELRDIGVDARNLAGGMAAWARVHVTREVPGLPPGAYLLQLDRVAKGCLSYVLGAQGGPALVVDPDRNRDDYLEALAARRSRLAAVVDTHLHADHVSGAPQLAEAAGVPYLLVDDGGALRDHRHPADGEAVLDTPEVDVRAVALYSPGHTPGSTGILVGDRFLLSGDTLFVEGVGRPDLGGRVEEWARDLHRTLTERLASLSDDVLVLPAHYQSRGERDARGLYAARLGDLRRHAEFTAGLDAFLADVAAGARPAPPEYGRIRRVNLGAEPLADDLLDELEVGRNQCAAGGTTAVAT